MRVALLFATVPLAISIGMAAPVAFLFPPSAHADDPCTGDPGCPHFGHLVCEQIDGGLSSGQVAESAMITYDLSKIMAASVVSGAIVKYCPWDEGK